jgi:phospholipase C
MSIEHIVIIVKENHAFDNYFGAFPNANGARLGQAQNPPPSDPPHDHLTWMHRASDSRFHLQYTENDISGYFNYAQKYTLSDNYFTEVAGPSTPNHLMLICADAPIINNPTHLYNPRPSDTYRLSSLPLQLERAQLTWGNYGGYAFHYIRELAAHQGNHTRDLFLQHASSGQLPSVSWVYGDGRPDLSEHPRQNVTDGKAWTVEQVKAVVTGVSGIRRRSSSHGTIGAAGTTAFRPRWLKLGKASTRNVRLTHIGNLTEIRFATGRESVV